MVYQGCINGILLGAGYAFLIIVFHVYESSILEAVFHAIIPAVFVGILSSYVGMAMGAINGILMGAVKRSRHLTFTTKKRISYGINLLVVLGAIWLISDDSFDIDWFLLGMPSIIALAASLLATERHFNLLLTRSDARKSKAKRGMESA
jgi:hypothetical protein